MYEKLKDTGSLVRLYVEGHHWDEVSTLYVCLSVCACMCAYVLACVHVSVCLCMGVCTCMCMCAHDHIIAVMQAFNVVKKQGEYKVNISIQYYIHN